MVKKKTLILSWTFPKVCFIDHENCTFLKIFPILNLFIFSGLEFIEEEFVEPISEDSVDDAEEIGSIINVSLSF